MAGRNPTQGLPNRLFEGRATNVEGQIQAFLRRIEEGHDLSDRVREARVVRYQARVREGSGQFAVECALVVTQQYGGNASGVNATITVPREKFPNARRMSSVVVSCWVASVSMTISFVCCGGNSHGIGWGSTPAFAFESKRGSATK